MGRSGRAPAGAAPALAELLASGAEVTISAADAGVVADARSLWGHAAARCSDGHALVHAAGVLADAALGNQKYVGLRR